jgi:ferritin
MTLSANLLTLLSEQYALEVANSLFYSSLQSWAEMRGLTGTALFFSDQAAGERTHADKVLAYIHDRNEQLQYAAIVHTPLNPPSFCDAFIMAQERERMTTLAIVTIATQADVEKDIATEAWALQPDGLVIEQIEEERTIQTILDRIYARTGNSVPLDAANPIPADTPGAVIHDIDLWIAGLK